MSVIAAIRPSDWELPLFVHVLGAMGLIGVVLVVAVALGLAWARRGGEDSASLQRLGFRSLLLAAIPGFIVMRIGAQWVESEELGGTDEDPAWIGIGYITSDLGLILMIVAAVLAGLAVRRTRNRGGFGAMGKITTVLVGVILAAYLVAIWAMTAKPGS